MRAATPTEAERKAERDAGLRRARPREAPALATCSFTPTRKSSRPCTRMRAGAAFICPSDPRSRQGDAPGMTKADQSKRSPCFPSPATPSCSEKGLSDANNTVSAARKGSDMNKQDGVCNPAKRNADCAVRLGIPMIHLLSPAAPDLRPGAKAAVQLSEIRWRIIVQVRRRGASVAERPGRCPRPGSRQLSRA